MTSQRISSREKRVRARKRPPEPAHTARPERTSSQPDLLELQQAVGNRAVQRLLHLETGQAGNLAPVQRWSQEEAQKQVPNAPSWASDEAVVRSMQRQLRRLGFYAIGIDGDYGRGTDAALVEAFGGNEFRSLSAATAVERLQAAQPPEGKRGEHAFRYGEMFKDGLLDMTLGLGYDENLEQNPEETLVMFYLTLMQRGFIPDPAGAAELYKKAGRAFQPSIADQYFVRRNALVYNPPASNPRPIHAVIRLVSNVRGAQGAEARKSFKEGMENSDILLYAGHGRYGTGPDFDRNFAYFDLQDLNDPSISYPLLDYNVLEQFLQKEAKQRRTGRNAWQQFLWRHSRGLIDVKLKNEGNLRFNPRTPHSNEFGGRLIDWAMNQGKIKPMTGPEGELALGINPQRKYQVAVFNGCRTRDYETSLRASPGYTQENVRLITTSRTVFGGDDVKVLAAFLDSVLRQQSAEQTIRDMDQVQDYMRQNVQNPTGTFRNLPAKYEPVTR